MIKYILIFLAIQIWLAYNYYLFVQILKYVMKLRIEERKEK